MEYKNIDKEIYHLSEIRKTLRPQYWAFICMAFGVIGVFGLMKNPDASWAVGLAGLGGFALVVWILYVLTGDSRAPFHKPSRKLLTREYYYYADASKEALMQALMSGDEQALSGIKRTSTPQIVLVRYSDVEETVRYSQLKEVRGKYEIPITDIIA